jgi:hypothetical protein
MQTASNIRGPTAGRRFLPLAISSVKNNRGALAHHRHGKEVLGGVPAQRPHGVRKHHICVASKTQL